MSNDEDDTQGEGSAKRPLHPGPPTHDEIIHTIIAKIQKCETGYQETQDPKNALLALVFLGKLNEAVAGWASESLAREVIKNHQVEFDKIDDSLAAPNWPPEALRELLAALAKTMNIGLLSPLAQSIRSDLDLANLGIKPEWFLVRGEKQTESAKKKMVVAQNRKRKKLCQIWFVGWVYYSGYHGDGKHSYKKKWEALAEELGADPDSIEKWAYRTQSTGLDKFFWKDAVREVKEWAKFCKTQKLDGYFPDGAEEWFQYNDEIFEQRVTEYLSLKHI